MNLFAIMKKELEQLPKEISGIGLYWRVTRRRCTGSDGALPSSLSEAYRKRILAVALSIAIGSVCAAACLIALPVRAASPEPGLSAAPNPPSADDLRKSLQNPIGSLISVPIETTFDFGAPDGDATFIQLQPVYPFHVGDWNLVNRTIIPLIDAPGAISGLPGNPVPAKGSRAFGLGDILHSTFLSPANAGRYIWGIGPAIAIPSATTEILGSGKWSLGPTVVVLTQPKPWSIGVLVANLWSFAGDSQRSDINQLMLQPFISYNLSDGWYLTTAPLVTANWNANSSDRWLVPVGGGAGRLFNIGKQPVNINLQAYYNAVQPSSAPDWAVRFTIQLVFPK